MSERKKNILLGVLVVGIVAMTVVYASLSQNLNINGTAKVKNLDSSWNIHFAHITNTSNEVHTSGYATTPSSSITLDDTTVTVPEVTLKAPGDKVEYIFKVVNEGDITGYVNVINNIGIGTITFAADETLISEQRVSLQNDIQVTLTYNDLSKTAIAYNDALAKTEEKELILTIQYVNRDTTQVLPSQDVTFTNIKASITYGQDETSNSGTGPTPAPSRVEDLADYTMEAMCPGCVFAKYTKVHYIDGINSPDTLEGITTYTDYHDLNSNVFSGHILDSNGKIKRSFACGIENGNAFCLEGKDKSKYANNIDILNHFFPDCSASAGPSLVTCDGSTISQARVYRGGGSGAVRVISSDGNCYAGDNGAINC